MNRRNMIISLISLIISLSLLGIIVGEYYEISRLHRKISQINQEIENLKNASSTLGAQYAALNKSYHELLKAYEKHVTANSLSEKFFFIQDPWFNASSLDETVWWGVEAWNENPDSVSEIENGSLHLFYNGTIDWSYGNSGVFQGIHTDGRRTYPLLIGDSSENSFLGGYVIFPKNLQSGEFWLKTKFKISRMGFNLYPSVYHPDMARVNLGITLICAINNQPFNLEAQTLWLDTYFAGYCLNKTNIWTVPKNWSYVNYSDDIFAGYFVDEISPQNLGQWIELSIDLGDYISKTLNLITQVDIKTIRVYGFIVFVEALGAYAEVDYDYIETHRA